MGTGAGCAKAITGWKTTAIPRTIAGETSSRWGMPV
jgi:hypothetical protein